MPHIFSKRIMYAGFCLTFMTFASLYWSEQYISSGLAAVLSATGYNDDFINTSKEE